MRLADLLAKGVTAEGTIRALADALDEDWQVYLDQAQQLSDLDAAATATAKAEAIAKYRALVQAVVDTWDAQDAPSSTPTIPVRPA